MNHQRRTGRRRGQDATAQALLALIEQGPVAPAEAEAEVEDRSLTLGDGRNVGAAVAGPASACPVVYLHGFLGSRRECFAAGPPPHRLIGIDRPGYGWSDAQTPPSLAGFGRDLAQALDRLGIDRLILIGVSGGAPFAIAGALALGARVRQLLLIGGVAGPEIVARDRRPARLLVHAGSGKPEPGSLVPPLAGFLRVPGMARAWLEAALLTERPSFTSMAAVDRLARRLAESFLTGTESGPEGVVADLRILSSAWDVDPGQLDVPTWILHGARDGVVSIRHARWYAKRLPPARLHLMPEHRHASAVLAARPMIDALVTAEAEAPALDTLSDAPLRS